MNETSPQSKAHGYVSAYLPAALIDELACEARRLDRSASWLLRRAWAIARREIRKLPTESL